jgi:hypothetical protein
MLAQTSKLNWLKLLFHKKSFSTKTLNEGNLNFFFSSFLFSHAVFRQTQKPKQHVDEMKPLQFSERGHLL